MFAGFPFARDARGRRHRMQKRRQTRDQWKRIIEDWQGGGKSQRQYCSQKGLVYSAFRYWFRKLAKGSANDGNEGPVQAIEISKTKLLRPWAMARATAKPTINACGIVIPIVGTDAAVTLSGRLSLEKLGRIIEACETRADHAWN
jgi:hypothetical protein